jgi:hypothetical protein
METSISRDRIGIDKKPTLATTTVKIRSKLQNISNANSRRRGTVLIFLSLACNYSVQLPPPMLLLLLLSGLCC